MSCPCRHPLVLVPIVAVMASIALAVVSIVPTVAGDDDEGPGLRSPLPAPAFSPFGDRAAAAIGADGTGAVVVVELGEKPSSRTVSRRGVDPHSARPRFSADGSRVAWTVGSAAMITSATKEGAVDKRSLSRGIDDFDPTSDWAAVAGGVYSPDGVNLAFVVPRGEKAGTFVAPVVGGTVIRLTKLAADRIAWSQDGKRLALALPKHDIVVVGADGKGEKPITRMPTDGGPVALRFADGGKGLLVFAEAKLGLYDIATGKTAGAPEGLIDDGHGSPVAAAWSPSEEILAIVTDGGALGLVKLSGKGRYVQVNAETDRVMSGPGWAPDGSRVGTVEFGGKGEVALVSYEVTTGEVKRVPLFWNPSAPPGD